MRRTRPADEYYLHYYFQHEHEVAKKAGQPSEKAEQLGNAAARGWVKEHVASHTRGFNKLPKVRFTHRMKHIHSYISAGDNVSVYSVPYSNFRFSALDKAKRPVT